VSITSTGFSLGNWRSLLANIPSKVSSTKFDISAYLVAVLNTSLSVPVRKMAAARYSLVPSVGFVDLALFFEEYEKPTTGEVRSPFFAFALTPRKKPLPENVVESVLRGMARDDNRVAPLRYLLQSKYLSSDRASNFKNSHLL
jgi:hypothetical protein